MLMRASAGAHYHTSAALGGSAVLPCRPIMPRPKARASLEPLREVIRDVGLRSTGPRVAVLEHLQATKVPLSHGELVEALAGHGYDAATIYRNLIDLTRVGLLSRINLADNEWRFELRGPNKATHPEHPHFVCTQCGEVTCLSQVRVKLTPAPGSTKSVVSTISEILIKGQCTQCG
jgi:Fur family ferric uptake transcriptional regulator